MFDFINRHKRMVQVLLFLFLVPPFVFFGVDRMQSPVGGESVAAVGGYQITQQEFNRALRDRQEAIQRATQNRASPELLNSSELRLDVLEMLIRQRSLLNHAAKAGIVVTDQHLQQVIAQIPAFQQDGKFSIQRYEQVLKAQGMTPAVFESQMRRDVLLQMIDHAVGGTAFAPRVVAARLARLSEQQREVSHHTVKAEELASQVKLEADAAKKYYDAHPEEFRLPEQARVEYVTLSIDAFLGEVTLEPGEVEKDDEANRGRNESEEQRQAAHILITVESPDAQAREKARARAEAIYQQLRQQPDRFAELAKQHSQDPGSAAKGGNLGYFGRGVTPKAFEDAVFQLKVGETSPVVESVDGFHIIRLTAVRAAQKRSLEEARKEIEAELRRPRAGKKFSEAAENFNNVVFEQSETLKPAAEIARSPVRQSGWITREGAVPPELKHPKLLQAIFSEEVIRNKRNTEAVEVTPGMLVAARVIEHKPAALRPFEAVHDAIVRKLTTQMASQLAAQSGRQQLEQLRQGKDLNIAWSAPQLVKRNESKALGEATLASAFRADAAKLPAYAGVEDGLGGYTLVRVTRVVGVEKVAPEQERAYVEGLRGVLGQEEMLAFVASLKQKAGVEINKAALEKKDR
jgi:peptidyl-prolyl cis-trans isomerase D